MSARGNRRKPSAGPRPPTPSSIPADHVEPPAANAAPPLCAFCMEHPAGPLGHTGLAQQVHPIPASYRSYVRLACVFCGAGWVRRRLSARNFEWLRIAA